MQDVARRVGGIHAEAFRYARLRDCHKAPEKKCGYQSAPLRGHRLLLPELKAIGMMEQKTRYGTFLSMRLARQIHGKMRPS
jgi:hypothetical protein